MHFKKKSNDLLWILFICGIIRLLFYLNLSNTDGWFPDTITYTRYPFNLFKGEIDEFRTPVYPYFIKLIRFLGEDHLLRNIKIAQGIISFLSLILFYKSIDQILKSRVVVITSTILYGISPSIINFDFCVLTESLSISSGVLFFYAITSYIKNPKFLKAIMIPLIAFILIMLRPSFIFLIVILFIFWVTKAIITKKDRLTCWVGLMSSSIAIVLLLGYARLNYINNGCFCISTVSTVNQLTNIINFGIHENGSDKEIISKIENNKDSSPIAANVILNSFKHRRISKFISYCIFNNINTYLSNTWQKFLNLNNKTTECILALYNKGFGGTLRIITNILSIRFIYLYIILIVDFVVIIFLIFKGSEHIWVKIVLWLFISGQLFTTILGGHSEYQRLFSIAIPYVIILLFYYADIIFFSINPTKIFEYFK